MLTRAYEVTGKGDVMECALHRRLPKSNAKQAEYESVL